MSRDPALLLDMLNAARKAQRFNSGVSLERFSSDELLQSATQYQIQIIGEAAGKVSREFQTLHPEIPWQRIVTFRHRLVHDYPRIELPKVWAVVENHLDPLIQALIPLVPPDEAPNAGTVG